MGKASENLTLDFFFSGHKTPPVFISISHRTLHVICLQGIRVDDMRVWRLHWNHQLYKALEHQYQTGLEALNKNLPEIQIDLVFKSVIFTFHLIFVFCFYMSFFLPN